MDVVHFILSAAWFVLPAGVANTAPVLLRPVLHRLDRPVDFGAELGGRPVFGRNKTWRGLLAGPPAGMLAFYLQGLAFDLEGVRAISAIDYDEAPVWWGALIGAGALLGDLAKSFFKRRIGVLPGSAWFPFDQIDYVLGAFVMLLPVWNPGLAFMLGTLVVGVGMHVLATTIGWLVGLRDRWV